MAMIGPGMWSIDARLYGRKHLEDPRHSTTFNPPKSTNARLSEKYNLEPPPYTETTIARFTVVIRRRSVQTHHTLDRKRQGDAR